MTRRAAVVQLAACLALVTALHASPARAHNWPNHYNTSNGYTSRWDTDQIQWYFTPTYWNKGVSHQQVALSATSSWSSVPGGYVWFRNMGTAASDFYEQCSNNGAFSVLRWAPTSDDDPMVHWPCYKATRNGTEWSRSGFAITVDADPHFVDGSAATWYAGTGQGAGNQINLWDSLTHEFGHAVGHRVHFTEPELCPTDPNADHSHAPTMCTGSGWYGNDTNMRTLQEDDIHTMQGAYAQPPAPTTTTTAPPSGGGGAGGCHVTTDGDEPPSLNETNGGSLSILDKVRCL